MYDIYRWRLGAWVGYYAVTGFDWWDGPLYVRTVLSLGVPDPSHFTISVDSAEADTRVASVSAAELARLSLLGTRADLEKALGLLASAC